MDMLDRSAREIHDNNFLVKHGLGAFRASLARFDSVLQVLRGRHFVNRLLYDCWHIPPLLNFGNCPNLARTPFNLGVYRVLRIVRHLANDDYSGLAVPLNCECLIHGMIIPRTIEHAIALSCYSQAA